MAEILSSTMLLVIEASNPNTYPTQYSSVWSAVDIILQSLSRRSYLSATSPLLSSNRGGQSSVYINQCIKLFNLPLIVINHALVRWENIIWNSACKLKNLGTMNFSTPGAMIREAHNICRFHWNTRVESHPLIADLDNPIDPTFHFRGCNLYRGLNRARWLYNPCSYIERDIHLGSNLMWFQTLKQCTIYHARLKKDEICWHF